MANDPKKPPPSKADELYQTVRDSVANPRVKNIDKELLERKKMFRNLVFGGATREEIAEALKEWDVDPESKEGKSILEKLMTLRYGDE